VLDDSGADVGFVVNVKYLRSNLSGTNDLYCTLFNGDIMAICTLSFEEPPMIVETTLLGRNWEEQEPVVGRFLVADVLKRAHNGYLSNPSSIVGYPPEIGTQILSPIPSLEEIAIAFQRSPQALKLSKLAEEENTTGEKFFISKKYDEAILNFQRATVFGHFCASDDVNANYLFNLAYCYYALGRLGAAEKWVEVSIKTGKVPKAVQLQVAIKKALMKT